MGTMLLDSGIYNPLLEMLKGEIFFGEDPRGPIINIWEREIDRMISGLQYTSEGNTLIANHMNVPPAVRTIFSNNGTQLSMSEHNDGEYTVYGYSESGNVKEQTVSVSGLTSNSHIMAHSLNMNGTVYMLGSAYNPSSMTALFF